MYKTVFALLISGALTSAHAQSTIDSVLAQIAVNNKSLMATVQLLEAEKLQYQTGLTPADPVVEYDYLFGTPADLGNQTDLIVTQSFDFPTAYSKKGEMADAQIEMVDFEASIHRQDVLLEAQLLCIDLIYLNKTLAQLEVRVENTQGINEDLQVKLANEEISVLDANKGLLVLLNAETQLQLLESERDQLLFRLTEMNGGIPIDFADVEYPILAEVPEVDSLEAQIEQVDPVLKMYEQEIEVGELQVELAKAMALPKVETGYHYQAILGQNFNGVHIGISIPLWENKNTIKQSQAYSLYTQFELEQHRTMHQYEIRELHEQYEVLDQSVSQYAEVLGTLNSEELLLQMLELEQISFTEYALEVEYYYSAINQYLQLEKELHLSVAKLYKHTL